MCRHDTMEQTNFSMFPRQTTFVYQDGYATGTFHSLQLFIMFKSLRSLDNILMDLHVRGLRHFSYYNMALSCIGWIFLWLLFQSWLENIRLLSTTGLANMWPPSSFCALREKFVCTLGASFSFAYTDVSRQIIFTDTSVRLLRQVASCWLPQQLHRKDSLQYNEGSSRIYS